jgi:hypothetical protein
MRRAQRGSNVGLLLFAESTVVVKPVDGKLSVLADFDDVAIGIPHIAAPFPAVRIG